MGATIMTWDARCKKEYTATNVLMGKIMYSEWKKEKRLGTGAGILIQALREKTPLKYEVDPTGRHKMKPIYYILYRMVIGALHLWSRPALWLDTHYWIKMDQFGTGLGAYLGFKILNAERGLLGLLTDGNIWSSIDCHHTVVDKEASARLVCPLCQRRTLARYMFLAGYLDKKLQAIHFPGGR